MERETFRTETAADFRRRFNTLDVFMGGDEARPILEFAISERRQLQLTIHRFGPVSRLSGPEWQEVMRKAACFYEEELASEAAVHALVQG